MKPSETGSVTITPLTAAEIPAAQPDLVVETPHAFGKYEKWQWHHLWWLVAFAALGVLMLGGNAEYADAMRHILPETRPDPSTFNERQSGHSAFYELCSKVGLKTDRWQSPYRFLQEKKAHGTLVLIDPQETPGDADSVRLRDWVREGNTVVYWDYFGYGYGRKLLRVLGAEARGPVSQPREEVTSKSDTDKAWKHVGKVVSRTDTTLGLPTADDDASDATKEASGETAEKIPVVPIPLVKTTAGNVLMTLPLGKGKCLLGSDPLFCNNEHIANPKYKGNFQLIINYLSTCPQPIYFDERAQGNVTAASTVYFMMHEYGGLAIAQLMLIAIVAWLSESQRFGQAQPVSNARRISNLEFIDGLASTFRRAHARSVAWAMIFAPLKTRLFKSLGVAPDQDFSVLAKAWASATGESANDYEKFLVKAQAATESKLSEKEFLELIAESDQLAQRSRDLIARQRILGA